MDKIIHKELGFKVLGMAYTVHNILGPGLLEHAYKEAMCVELKLAGIPYVREQVFPLEYKGENVGTYFADIVVDNKIIIECKSVEQFHPSMEAQIINYLKVSGIEVGYLINFQNRKVVWRRFVYQRADSAGVKTPGFIKIERDATKNSGCIKNPGREKLNPGREKPNPGREKAMAYREKYFAFREVQEGVRGKMNSG